MNPLAGKSLVVLNTSAETIELLTLWFEAQGMTVHSATVTEFRKGERDLGAFITATRPDVVIFDVALPYVANWQFLQAMRDGPLSGIPVIVTTPNAQVLGTVSNVLSPESTHEIIGKPADMQELTEKARNQIAVGV